MPTSRTPTRKRRVNASRRSSRRRATTLNTKRNTARKTRKTAASQRQRVQTRCKNALRQQIAKNMREWKRGRYVSQKQALAVSYSQIRRRYPSCRRMLGGDF